MPRLIQDQLTLLVREEAWAHISECGKYRYALGRRWGEGHGVTFVLLNPSTADATKDDPTTRALRQFATRWGYAAYQLVNLYGYRATDPSELTKVADPVGPFNDEAIYKAALGAPLIVCAWGTKSPDPQRAKRALDIISGQGQQAMRIGASSIDGHPKHPLYLKRTTPLEAHA